MLFKLNDQLCIVILFKYIHFEFGFDDNKGIFSLCSCAQDRLGLDLGFFFKLGFSFIS